VSSYRDLKVFQLADELDSSLFNLTNKFPRIEDYGITSQLRRAMSSVVANIAEGFGRKHYQQEYVRFLTFARASCNESREHLRMAFKRGYCSIDEFNPLDDKLDHVGKMLTLLMKKVINDQQAKKR
jgi:four helix bundle protein